MQKNILRRLPPRPLNISCELAGTHLILYAQHRCLDQPASRGDFLVGHVWPDQPPCLADADVGVTVHVGLEHRVILAHDGGDQKLLLAEIQVGHSPAGRCQDQVAIEPAQPENVLGVAWLAPARNRAKRCKPSSITLVRPHNEPVRVKITQSVTQAYYWSN